MQRACVALFLVLAASLIFQGGCRDRSGRQSSVPRDQMTGLRYQVVAGDTLSTVSAAYGISVRAIIDANNLQQNTLTPGQQLLLPGVTARVAPVVVTPPPAVAVAPPKADWYVPRAEWTTQKILKNRVDPMGVKPYRITVHHSADIGMSTLNAPAALREVERQHIAGAGKNTPFACIGYHFIIGDDGTVYEGRPIEFQGAHATGTNNIGNIGICLLGDFDTYRPSIAQRNKLYELMDRLCKQYGIAPSNKTILCHKDFKPTECPGHHLEPLVRAYARQGGGSR